MRITLNGEIVETASANIAALLREHEAPLVGVAVAVNGRVVRRAEHEDCAINECDVVEIIRAVQGG